MRENSHFLFMTNKPMIYFLPLFLLSSLSLLLYPFCMCCNRPKRQKMRLVYRCLYKNALQGCCATFDVHKDYVLWSLSFLRLSKKGQISKGKAWGSRVHWWHQSRGRQTGLSSLAFHFLVSGCTDYDPLKQSSKAGLFRYCVSFNNFFESLSQHAWLSTRDWQIVHE